jgi:hypothetical protein
MNTRQRSTLFALAFLLVCGALFAQGRINRLQIVIKDISSHEDIATVEPGGTVDVPRGGPVRVIMSAFYSSGKTIYPVTTYSDPKRGGVGISRGNAENGAVDLDLSQASGEREQFNFLIADDRIPGDMRRGTFYIRVVRSSGGPHEGEEHGREHESRGARLTRMLYQAILLRDPDPGAAGTIRSIEEGGYEAVVRAAEGIADSDESRVRIYENGSVTHERRLISLYRNLLDMDASEVNRTTWDRDLHRLSDGQIAAVVRDIVHSDRFRARVHDRF